MPAAERRTPVAANAVAAAIYAAIQTAAGLVLYGYLIRTLGAESVGVWITILATGMLACTGDLALNHALVRPVAAATAHGDAGQAALAIETAAISVAVVVAVALGGLLLAFDKVMQLASLGASHHVEAIALAPFMAAGLWLNRMGDVYGGALEALQRFIPRCAIGVVGFGGGLILAVMLVGSFGLKGAAIAFVAQNALILIGNVMALKRASRGIRVLTPRWDRDTFRRMLGYGLAIQGVIASFLLVETGAKLLLARGGFLAEVSYFDLLFRIGRGVRSLLASGLRVLVPRLASSFAVHGRREAAYMYRVSFDMVSLVAVPCFALLAAGSGVLSLAIVGSWDSRLVMAAAISLPAWLAYSLIDPALNDTLASGRLRWPLLGHFVAPATMALLASALGPLLGAAGIMLAVSLGIMLGCGVVLGAFHRFEGIAWATMAPLRTLGFVAAGVATGALGLATTAWTTRNGHGLGVAILALLPAAIVIAIAAWRQPSRPALAAHLSTLRAVGRSPAAANSPGDA